MLCASVHRFRFRTKWAGHCGILSLRLRTVYPDAHNSEPVVHHCFPEPYRGHQRHWRIGCRRHELNALRGLRQCRRSLHNAGLVFRGADATDIAHIRGIADVTRITRNELPRASEGDAAYGSARRGARRTSTPASVDLFQRGRNCRRGSARECTADHEDLFEPGCGPARTAEWVRKVRQQDGKDPVNWRAAVGLG